MNQLKKVEPTELAKSDAPSSVEVWRANLAGNNPELWSAVLFVLDLYEIAGIIKQKECKFDIDDPNKIAFYVEDCLAAEVDHLTLRDHHAKVRRSLKWWPTPTEFARAFNRFKGYSLWPDDCQGYIVRGDSIVICDRRSNPEAYANEAEAKKHLPEHLRIVKALPVPLSAKVGMKRISDTTDIIITDEDIKRFEKKKAQMLFADQLSSQENHA